MNYYLVWTRILYKQDLSLRMKLIILLIVTGIVAEGGLSKTLGDQYGNQFFTERRYPKGHQALTTSRKPPQTKSFQVNTELTKNFNFNRNKETTNINRSPENRLTSLMPVLFEPASSKAAYKCASTCVGRTTSEYNPVCGTDQENYHNRARLDCARDCGIHVEVSRVGTCRSLLSSVLTGDLPPH